MSPQANMNAVQPLRKSRLSSRYGDNTADVTHRRMIFVVGALIVVGVLVLAFTL